MTREDKPSLEMSLLLCEEALSNSAGLAFQPTRNPRQRGHAKVGCSPKADLVRCSFRRREPYTSRMVSRGHGEHSSKVGQFDVNIHRTFKASGLCSTHLPGCSQFGRGIVAYRLSTIIVQTFGRMSNPMTALVLQLALLALIFETKPLSGSSSFCSSSHSSLPRA